MSDRPIKFRGKDSASGEWHYGAYIPPEYTKWQTPSIFDGCHRKEIDPDTLGQYTGYKDVNAIEIYEGDLVQDVHKNIVNWSNLRMIVRHGVFNAGYLDREKMLGFYVDIANKGMENMWDKNFLYWALGLGISDGVKVIGNIYDNPELLEAKK